jgi:C-terminal processing protease CtpA/Prc
MRSAFLVLLLSAVSAAAQTPTVPVPASGPSVAESAARALEDNYVFPEVGSEIAALLRAKEKDGRYAALTDPAELAKVLTADIQSVNGDKHLRVRPASAAAGAAVRPADGNQGVARAEILPGNVGYLDLRVFPPLFLAQDALASAMHKVAGTRALIIDLRRHRGGAPDTVAFACSYLFGDTPVHLNSIYRRTDDSTADFHTDPGVPGPRFGPDKPVYLLTSGSTFSAGEEFAYDLQAQKRATLIGETTGGGANPGAVHPLPLGLTVFVSNGRAINPVTGTNWEGVGVKPDIAVPLAEAFPVAYRKALEGVDSAQLPAADRDRIAELLKDPPVPQ